jgi:DNA-binding MarR family transcriptional regulator
LRPIGKVIAEYDFNHIDHDADAPQTQDRTNSQEQASASKTRESIKRSPETYTPRRQFRVVYFVPLNLAPAVTSPKNRFAKRTAFKEAMPTVEELGLSVRAKRCLDILERGADSNGNGCFEVRSLRKEVAAGVREISLDLAELKAANLIHRKSPLRREGPNQYRVLRHQLEPLSTGTLLAEAKLLYAVLLRKAGQSGRCVSTQKALADELGATVRQVQRYLSQLVKADFIRVQRYPGTSKPNTYECLNNKREPVSPWKKFDGYLPIPQELMRITSVSAGAKLLFGALALHSGKDGRCFPFQRTLARKLGVSIRQTQRYIRELTRARLIRSIRQPQTRSKWYEFLRHPELGHYVGIIGEEEDYDQTGEGL